MDLIFEVRAAEESRALARGQRVDVGSGTVQLTINYSDDAK